MGARLTHHLLKPLVMIWSLYSGRDVKAEVAEKRENGFKDARIAELDRALERTIERVGENHGVLISFRNVIVTILDDDPWYGRYALDILIEELAGTNFWNISHKPYNFTTPNGGDA
jgi:hypothetical protein